MSESCHFKLANRIPELGKAIVRIDAYMRKLGVGDRAVYVVNLAFEEMATNIVKYGYDDKLEHLIEVSLEPVDGALRLTLVDDGHEFDPVAADEADTSSKLHEREIGGLGIHLVRSMASSMRYERSGGRNRLEVIVALND